MLNDRMPCQGHSADLVAQQLSDAVVRLECESVLLDFQRPPDTESRVMVETIMGALPCPAAVTEAFAIDLGCPVFLSPSPLHTPLQAHLEPWHGREIWLEAALCQERITVTGNGSTVTPIFPTQQLDGGLYDNRLYCRYHTAVTNEHISFTLYDTPDTLREKLRLAQSLGVVRAIGLYQELETFLTGKQSS